MIRDENHPLKLIQNQSQTFDYKKMSMSARHADRLNRALDYAHKYPCAARKVELWSILHRHEVNPEKGYYTPLASITNLTDKLQPQFGIVPAPPTGPLTEPFPYPYFATPLILPDRVKGYGFKGEKIVRPKDRVVNTGTVIVTHEVDCTTPDELDALGELFMGERFSKTAIKKVHDQLCAYKEYRAVTVDFSGRRSYHIHFHFDTRHLIKAPFDADAKTRWETNDFVSPLMNNIYDHLWDVTEEALTVLPLPAPLDRMMRNAVQYRRAPHGVRVVLEPDEKDRLFGLDAGDCVPQVVVLEHVSPRAYPGASKQLIAPEFSVCPPQRKSSRSPTLPRETLQPEVLDQLRLMCSAAWGEYPRPERITRDGGQCAIYFSNSPSDRTPSTVVRGTHGRLLLQGRHDFDRDFFLPDDFDANEIVAHASARFGIRVDEVNYLHGEDRRELITRARAEDQAKIHHIADLLFIDKSMIICGPTGSGKSTMTLNVVRRPAKEPWESGIEKGDIRVTLFGSKSLDQAEKKMDEFLSAGKGQAILWKGFNSLYTDCCRAAGLKPIDPHIFESREPTEVWSTIATFHPTVIGELRRHIEAMWDGIDLEEPVMIFTSLATLGTWCAGRVSRVLFHPRFTTDLSTEEAAALTNTYRVQAAILDDFDVSDILHILDEEKARFIRDNQEKYPDWKDMTYRERLAAYNPRSKKDTFDAFDADIRIDLDALEEVSVDYNAIPFGEGRTDKDAYRKMDGGVFRIGPKEWVRYMPAPLVFLTTEQVVEKTIHKVYGRIGKHIFMQRLEPRARIHPVRVPIVNDARACKERVRELVAEILESDPSATVICNHLGDDDRIATFSNAKGRNDLADDNIYAILTMLNPNYYAQLNALGRWLHEPDIIALHYRDIATQAVGRNTGYRDTDNGRQSMVVLGAKLRRANYFPIEPIPNEPVEEKPGVSLPRPKQSQTRHLLYYIERRKPWLEHVSPAVEAQEKIEGADD